MKRNLFNNLLLAILFLGTSFTMAYAQNATLVAVPTQNGTAPMMKVSANGKWAVGYAIIDAKYHEATLWDLETYEEFSLFEQGIPAGAFDVTNDGTIVVGCYLDAPAYWQDGEWTHLPLPEGFTLGEVHSVNEDGTKMVGRAFTSSLASAYACLWENGELIEITLPEEDHTGDTAMDNELVAISQDGNTILGCLNYFYLPQRTAFIRVNGENYIFGDKWYDPEYGGSEYNFFDVLSMSRNGKWVTGDMYYDNPPSEFFCPFIYDVENDIVEIFPNDVEVASFAADDNGNLFGATPLNYPIRSALILHNGSWVSLDNYILQNYGLDVYEETEYDELGNLFSVSADGKTLVGVSGLVVNNWVLKLDVEDDDDNGDDDDNTGIDSQLNDEHKIVVKDGQMLVGGKVAVVEIFNIMGQKVFEKQTHGSAPVFNVSHFTSGIYIVRVMNTQGTVSSTKVWIGN